jgi:hypothetical protein
MARTGPRRITTTIGSIPLRLNEFASERTRAARCPAPVDLFWVPDDRLEMIRIENASDRLTPETLNAAVPFVPLRRDS